MHHVIEPPWKLLVQTENAIPLDHWQAMGLYEELHSDSSISNSRPWAILLTFSAFVSL